MSGPPPNVHTGLMRGGPLDGCMVEIDAGAERLDFGEWPLMPTEAQNRRLGLPTYQYSGEVDAEGYAVYRLAE